MNRIWIALIASLVIAGCSNATTSSVNAPALYTGDNPDAGTPANFACNGMFVDSNQGPAMDTVVNGKIQDFQDSYPVANAVVSIYLTTDQVLAKMPVAHSMPSAMDGTYSITVPKGTPYRVIRGVEGGYAINNGTMSSTVASYEFGINWDDIKPVSVKEATRQAIPGLVSVEVLPGTGIVAGAVHDCMDKETKGALVKVTSSTYDSAAMNLVFYFISQSGSTLPTRTQKWTREGAAFAALNVGPAPGAATVEAQGIIGSGGMQKIASASIPIIADSVTIVHLTPLAK